MNSPINRRLKTYYAKTFLWFDRHDFDSEYNVGFKFTMTLLTLFNTIICNFSKTNVNFLLTKIKLIDNAEVQIYNFLC